MRRRHRPDDEKDEPGDASVTEERRNRMHKGQVSSAAQRTLGEQLGSGSNDGRRGLKRQRLMGETTTTTRDMSSTCAGLAETMRREEAERGEEGLTPATRARIQALAALAFDEETSTARFRRAMLVGVRKFTKRGVSVFVEAFVERAKEELEGESTNGAEALRRTSRAACAYGASPKGEVELGMIAGVPRGRVVGVLADGLRMSCADARSGTRATPEEVDLLSNGASVAYELTHEAHSAEDVESLRNVLIPALMDVLCLENAPSRDATLTSGVAVARACARDEEPSNAIQTARLVAKKDGVDAAEILARAGASASVVDNFVARKLTLSSFGALALVRGFVIALGQRPSPGADDALCDDLFPRVCDQIEGAVDVHHRFHAVCALRVALETFKSMETDKKLSREVFSRVEGIIASHWEDTLGQTVREAQTCFGLLLDVIADERIESVGAETSDAYTRDIIQKTLKGPAEQKRKYLAACVLITRVGASRLLAVEPDLFAQTLDVMRVLGIAPAASNMLTDLSASLLKELGDAGKWRQWWLAPLAESLVGEAHIRSSVVTYLLPSLLKQNGESVLELMELLVNRASDRSDARNSSAVVSVLKVARNLQLVDAKRITLLRPNAKSATYEVPRVILEDAMSSADRSARLDSLEWLCLESKKGAVTLPGTMELDLLGRMLPTNLRGESVSFRNTVVTLMSKLFIRMWTGINHVAQKARRRGDASLDKGLVARAGEDALSRDIQVARENHKWLEDVAQTLFANVYPGAPFERRCTALELLNSIAEAWKTKESEYKAIRTGNDDLDTARELLKSPYATCTGETGTNMLLGALIDSWEKLRLTAFDMLQRHESPLAGIETPDKLEKRLAWAMDLLRSPRVRESGAAALMIRLLVRKYAFDLHWCIELSPNVKVSCPKDGDGSAERSARAQVLAAICDLLEHEIEFAERDVFKACQQSLVHGPVLLIKYMLHEIKDGVESQDETFKDTLSRMMALMGRAIDTALGFISQPDTLGATAEEVEILNGDMNDDLIGDDEENGITLAPRAQVISTACWLTVKETSLLTGDVLSMFHKGDIFSYDEIKTAGERLMNVLITVKHTGALDKTRMGMTNLCASLMRSRDESIKALPQEWLNNLIEQLNRPGQGMRDRVRRSAGLPYAFMSILLAEPKGQPRIALDWALPRLLDIASGETSSSDIPRVHAFNAMRMIFADRDLTVDTNAYAARGVQVCIDAFSSPTWQIQNAATLAFSSLLTKMCGYMHTVTRKRLFTADGRHEVKVHDFFVKFPTLLSYLSGELIKATKLSMRSSQKVALDVHPSLYPILALLSRLKPSLQRDLSGDGKDDRIDDFIAPVLCCASGKYLAIRTAAARSFVPLLPSDSVSSYIRKIFKYELVDDQARTRRNAQHGALLCLLEILTEVRAFTFGEDACSSEVARVSCEALISCQRHAVDLSVPIIAATWLNCAMMTVSIVNEKHSCKHPSCSCADNFDETLGALVCMLWECSAPVLASGADGHPGASDWFKAAASARVRLTLGIDAHSLPLVGSIRALVDVGDATAALRDALRQDAAYEYRAEAYKTLFKAPAVEEASVDSESLRDVAVDNISSEIRHSCVRRSLQCISMWSKSCRQSDESRVWDAVERTTTTCINERVRAEGMRCLATLCKRRLSFGARHEFIGSGGLDTFAGMLLRGSDPASSEETRLATVDALRASDILVHLNTETVSNEKSSETALNAWKCALTLMEDEDVDIRVVASSAAAKAVSELAPGAQSEVVLRVVFAHMHAHFGHFHAFTDYMIDVAKGPSFDDAKFAQVIGKATNVRRLFDKEADNVHAEPLLFAQLAASQLAKTCDADKAKIALTDVSRSIHSITRALEAASDRNEAWVGGITSHEACFIPIANALLGAWAFSQRAQLDEQSRLDFDSALSPLEPLVAPSLRAIIRRAAEACFLL